MFKISPTNVISSRKKFSKKKQIAKFLFEKRKKHFFVSTLTEEPTKYILSVRAFRTMGDCGDKVNSSKGLSHRPARLHRPERQPYAESTLYHSQGLWIWLQPTLANRNDRTDCRLLFPGFFPLVTFSIPEVSAFPLEQERRETQKDWPAAQWMDVGSQQRWC